MIDYREGQTSQSAKRWASTSDISEEIEETLWLSMRSPPKRNSESAVDKEPPTRYQRDNDIGAPEMKLVENYFAVQTRAGRAHYPESDEPEIFPIHATSTAAGKV
jgi:hypothetical protein